MEAKSKISLGVASVLIAAMLVFPPEKGGGYDFIADISRGIDIWRLFVQIGIVGCLSFWATIISVGAVRIAGKILVGIMILFVAAFAFYYWSVEYPKSQVTVSVEYAPRSCSAEYPLLVRVSNKGSRKMVSKVNFSFAAYHLGRSTDLLPYKRVTFDKMVGPGLVQGMCWSLPAQLQHDPADLRYEATSKNIIWR